MADLIWTQDDIDTLKKAVGSGVLEVTFSDRSTRFQSLKDMRALLAEMTATSNPDARSYRLAAHDKGV